jgi:hypothetical protein
MAITILDGNGDPVSLMSATVGSDEAQQIGWA